MAAVWGQEAVVVGMPGRMPRSERQRSERTPLGLQVGAGVTAVVVATALAALLPASDGAWRLVPVAAAVAVVSARTVDPAAVVFVATVAYLLVIGFLVNRFGVLSWHGTGDIYRLLGIGFAAGVGLVGGAGWHRLHRPRPLIIPPAWVAPSRQEALTWTDKKEISHG